MTWNIFFCQQVSWKQATFLSLLSWGWNPLLVAWSGLVIEWWSEDRWLVTGDRWQMTHDRWHVIYDFRFVFVLVQLSAHIQRICVSCMQDFWLPISHKFRKYVNGLPFYLFIPIGFNHISFTVGNLDHFSVTEICTVQRINLSSLVWIYKS